jgi:hypothetical protein
MISRNNNETARPGEVTGFGLRLAYDCDTDVLVNQEDGAAFFYRLGVPPGLPNAQLVPVFRNTMDSRNSNEPLFNVRLVRCERSDAGDDTRLEVDEESYTQFMASRGVAEAQQGAPTTAQLSETNEGDNIFSNPNPPPHSSARDFPELVPGARQDNWSRQIQREQTLTGGIPPNNAVLNNEGHAWLRERMPLFLSGQNPTNPEMLVGPLGRGLTMWKERVGH